MIWFAAICYLSCVGAIVVPACNPSNHSSLKMTLYNYFNDTEDRNSKVLMEHGADRKYDGPWEVSVNQTYHTCSKWQTFNIEATLAAPPICDEPESVSAPYGYTFLEGFGFYKLQTSPKIWREAKKTCQKEGSKLLIIKSTWEAKVLVRFWKQIEFNRFFAFAGFREKESEVFMTIEDELVSSTGYEEWQDGRPNKCVDTDDLSCGGVNRDSRLINLNCKHESLFFCKKEL